MNQNERMDNDGLTPLRYEQGYVHTRCGGPAEMALPPNLSAHCLRCGYVVPTREVERRYVVDCVND